MTLLVGVVYGTCFILPEFREVYAAEIASSTASMSIANPTLSSTITPNNTTYVSTNVTIDAKYIQSYSLKISGNTNLSGPSTITGAGGKTPANMANNTWGYNWGNTGTTDSGLTYSSLSTSGTSLSLNSLSNGAANFTKKLTFAVKFGDANTGHYTGTVNLSFTATPKALTTYSVTYNVNGGTGGPSNWSEQSYDDSKTYTIPNTQPTKSGYNFLGWSTSSTATTADANYAPGKIISLTPGSPSRNLYAVWKERITWSNITKMQDMTTEICADAPTGNQKTLTDTRDGSTYTVSKLTDGKCWMTQNLRITRESIKAKNSSNTTGTVTSADTNTNSDYLIPASITTAFSSNKSDGTHYDNQQVRAATDNDYGAYYSYNVATLNKYVTQDSGTVAYDICPKGWRLPTGGSSGEFQALYNKGNGKVGDFASNSLTSGYWLGGAANASGAAFFSAAGYVNAYGLYGTGSEGLYWSSMIGSATHAYSLSFYSTHIYPAYTGNRYIGYSVRCVAK